MTVSTRQTAASVAVAVLSAAVTSSPSPVTPVPRLTPSHARRHLPAVPLSPLWNEEGSLHRHYDLGGSRIVHELTRAIEGLEREDALHAMGMAYLQLMQDPNVADANARLRRRDERPDIAAACRKTFEVLWHW